MKVTRSRLLLCAVTFTIIGLVVFDCLRIKYPDVPDLLVNVTECAAQSADEYIVPNVVHLLHFGSNELTFHELVSIKAAQKNQKPDKIYIHCDCYELKGKYWNMVRDIPHLELRYKKMPETIFGHRLNSVYHASDIARMEVLMEYGGIYIDTDVYIISSLDEFRRHEFTIGWPAGEYLGTQTLVANKNARFLRLWYNSYKYYVPKDWYYNAGALPTIHILRRMPCLVRRVPRDFGVDYRIREMMYEENNEDWRTYKTIHYLIRHAEFTASHVSNFNEENIKSYNRTFGAMARLAIYGTTDLMW